MDRHRLPCRLLWLLPFVSLVEFLCGNRFFLLKSSCGRKAKLLPIGYPQTESLGSTAMPTFPVILSLFLRLVQLFLIDGYIQALHIKNTLTFIVGGQYICFRTMGPNRSRRIFLLMRGHPPTRTVFTIDNISILDSPASVKFRQ